jgi:hypothetical protein
MANTRIDTENVTGGQKTDVVERLGEIAWGAQG